MIDFGRISFIVLALGYLLYVSCMNTVGIIEYMDTWPVNEKDPAEPAMLILGLLLYTAAILFGIFTQLGDFKGNFIITVVNAVLDYLACLFIIIGLAIMGANLNKDNPGGGGIIPTRKMPTYPTTLFSLSLIFAFTAGVLLTLQIAGVDPSKMAAKTDPEKPETAPA